MAAVPDLLPPSETAEAPEPAPFDPITAGITPRARASFAAVGGAAQGPELVVSDVSHVVVYRGATGFPTINRGKRGYRRTMHHHGAGDGLWRV